MEAWLSHGRQHQIEDGLVIWKLSTCKQASELIVDRELLFNVFAFEYFLTQ